MNIVDHDKPAQMQHFMNRGEEDTFLQLFRGETCNSLTKSGSVRNDSVKGKNEGTPFLPQNRNMIQVCQVNILKIGTKYV